MVLEVYRMKAFYTGLAILITVLAITGCSGNRNSPVESDIPGGLTKAPAESHSRRVLWGIYDICLDVTNLTAEVIPLRTTDVHFNITPMVVPPACSDCVAMKINSFNPSTRIMDMDITLKNPTAVSGHDVRGILYTNDYGHELRNADDYTVLWDIPGGHQNNPFKAFAKESPNRVFAGLEQHTENYLVYIPVPPKYEKIKYAVDASYPGNCKEPYSIDNFTQEEILNSVGSHGLVTVQVHDWQGDTNHVTLLATDITDVPTISMTYQGDDTWTTDLVNDKGVGAGTYPAEISSTSANSGTTSLNDFTTITITAPYDGGWARTWGGPDYDYGIAVAVDGSGNTYSTGYFKGTDVNFNPAGSDLHSSNGEYDVFLVKYDSYGNFQWARTWGGTEDDYGRAVATDSLGDVYIAGYFNGTDVNFDPGGSDLHSAVGGTDIFLSKFNSNGDFQWAKTWGGTDLDDAWGIVADGSNNVYVSGKFLGENVNFNPDGSDLHSSNGMDDAFISKFNSDGNFQWAGTWGGTGGDAAWALATVGSDNLFVAGAFNGTDVNFNPGGTDLHSSNGASDCFLSKFNSNGDFQWAKTWGGTVMDASFGVATDGSSGVYTTGNFMGTDVNFNPDGSDQHSSNGSYDIFLSKFDVSGNFQWAWTWGGSLVDSGNGVSVDGPGDIYVTGYFADINVNFNPAGSDIHSSNGSYDVFLSAFNPSGDFQWAGTWGSPESDVGVGVAADASDDVYVAGYFEGEDINFDPDGSDLHTSNGAADAFLTKFLSGGTW